MIERSRIASLIPHAGTMCLLDQVVAWDARSIHCLTTRHRSSDNPLKRPDGSIGAVCAIEFAAQAMALHGRLVTEARDPPKPGMLASVRDVQLHAAFLDRISEDIAIEAALLMGGGRGAAYSFALSAAGQKLVSGRATVIFDVTGL